MSEKGLSQKAYEALRFIRNDVMHFGKVPTMRRLMTGLYYKSPRSAMMLMDELEQQGFLKKREGGSYNFVRDLPQDESRTVNIPLVGSVPCGSPMLAEENIEAMIPVSVVLAKPGSKYFLLHAVGDSMNNADINDGDLVLVRQQETAESGQRVVALIDDEATIKEFYKNNNVVMLKPNSKNSDHQPIILTSAFRIQGIVVATIPKM